MPSLWSFWLKSEESGSYVLEEASGSKHLPNSGHAFAVGTRPGEESCSTVFSGWKRQDGERRPGFGVGQTGLSSQNDIH